MCGPHCAHKANISLHFWLLLPHNKAVHRHLKQAMAAEIHILQISNPHVIHLAGIHTIVWHRQETKKHTHRKMLLKAKNTFCFLMQLVTLGINNTHHKKRKQLGVTCGLALCQDRFHQCGCQNDLWLIFIIYYCSRRTTSVDSDGVVNTKAA